VSLLLSVLLDFCDSSTNCLPTNNVIIIIIIPTTLQQNSGFGDPDFLYDTDITAVGGHLPCDLDFCPIDLEHCISCHTIKLCTRFSANSSNPLLSYSDIKIENLGNVSTTDFMIGIWAFDWYQNLE